MKQPWRTSPVQQSILRELNRYPDGLMATELIEKVYGAREPEFALDSIYVAVWKLRKNMGIQIHMKNRRYTLFP